jgi:hypothetical protein
MNEEKTALVFLHRRPSGTWTEIDGEKFLAFFDAVKADPKLLAGHAVFAWVPSEVVKHDHDPTLN